MAGTTGNAGTTGTAGTTGNAGTTGTAGSGASGGRGGATAGSGGRGGASAGSGGRGGATAGTTGAGGSLPRFSFFVTSVGALRMLSGSQNGFGGDLRFGETGDGAGLRGADKICTTIAEMSMPGSGAKGWHAFLSAPGPVHAIDRIGNGPWYDRMGRLFSASKANLIGFRPSDADPAIKNDFPNENGTPNHSDGAPGCTGNNCPDNHDSLTGSNDLGQLYVATNSPNPTCTGWTTTVGSAGKPRVGHSWPRMPSSTNTCTGGGFPGGGTGGAGGGCYGHWMSSLDEAGCAAGINLMEMGGPNPNNPTVGSGGGYGGFFCFAMTP